MILIDAEVFLKYLIFSKHIDSLKCRDVKEAVEMSKVDVFDKIRDKIKALPNSNPSYWHSGDMVDRDDVFEIIDDYRESEDDKE